MAQIIKNRRGSLDRLSSATGSLQKGEILIATGSSKLTGVTNGQGLVFAAVESGSVVAANRVLQGATAPIFSASAYGNLMDGVPFYASSSNTLFLLGADGNEAIDLSGNIADFSSSVSSSFASLSQSVASVTGDFSSSVATSFSASAFNLNELSASTYHAVFGFGELSSSIEQSISASSAKAASDLNSYSASAATTDSASAASQNALSGAVATTISNLSSSIATTDSASAASIASLSASVASVTGDFSSSVATSFSASAASQLSLSSSVATTISTLSSSIATTDSASAAYAAAQLSDVSGAFATSTSASNAAITSLSASVASVTGDFSASVATSFSQSAHNLNDLSSSVTTTISNLSASIATTDSASAASQTALSGAVATTISNLSSSVATTISASAASQNTLSASIASTDNAQSDRLSVIESTYATTGSNTFVGTEVISGSLYITQNLVVYGSSSVQNVTASAVSIGTNTVVLNTANPAIRFGGIQVIDSGSSQATGSLLWDSENNVWIYTNPSGAGYASARLIAGPQNTGSLGNEIGLTTGYVPVALGDDHIGDSIISASATKVTIGGGLDVTGNISASTISGIGNVTDFSSSVSASIASINSNLGSGGSLGGRVASLEALTGSYATTGSNTFTGNQNLGANSLTLDGGNVETTNGGIQLYSNDFAQLQYDGTSYVWVDNNGAHLEVNGNSAKLDTNGDFVLPSYTLPNATGNANTVLSNDGNGALSWVDLVNSASVATSFSASAASVTSLSSSVATDFSASAASVTSVSASLSSVSGAFATSTSASNAEIAALSASVASVGGTFSQSVATDFSASNAAREALSASIASDVNTLSQSFDSRIAANDFLDSTYATTGSNVFHGDQVITGSLDLTGTANFNNAVAVNDSNMNLGNSSSLNLTGGSSIYVAAGGTISGSITGIGNVSLFSASVDSRFSASAYDVAVLSASVASTTGDFSSSVAGRLNTVEVRYATTGSNTFNGNQTIGGTLTISGSQNYIAGYGGNSIYLNTKESNTLNSKWFSGSGDLVIQTDGTQGANVDIVTTVPGNVNIAATGDVNISTDLHTFGWNQTSDIGNVHVTTSMVTIHNPYAADNAAYLVVSGSISASQGFSGSINGIGNVSEFSSSVDTRFSASAAAMASVTGDFSASVATSFSASAASVTELSSSVATSFSASAASVTNLSASIATTDSASAAYAASQLNSVSGAFATSTSASNAAIAELSASVASTTGDFSSSVAGRLTTIETTYATTGSNEFVGQQTITGDVIVSGSLFVQFGQDLVSNHISGNQGKIELGNTDNNIHIIAENELMLTATGSGVHVHDANFSVSPAGTDVLVVSASITKVTNEFSASNINGVGNIGAFSQSVDQRLVSLVNFQNTASTALEFDGTNVTVLGNLTVQGTQTAVDSTIVNIGDNIISLNGTGGAYGGLVVKDPTAPNTASGSLLWDSTNDYWIAGASGSESKVLLAVGDNVVSSSAQIELSSTTGFSTFDTAISTSFSASNASISSLSASVASVTGDFSSSVATSFSASNASIAALSASVASVTGDFSSSVATSFSASAFDLNALSASIYQTDATQSVAINDNSSSFATSISASNFRITVLETTIDGGSF